ncbi:MAG: hypothetical protein IKV17_07200 [Bacteroidaceae bacterium]|nr:hypothetical protein [Bacteroidaceae bacterium]
MKKISMTIAVASLLAMVSCGENIEKSAQLLVDEARAAYEAQDYIKAKLLLDSTKRTYPKALKARRAALYLGRDVELAEQQRSVDYFNEEIAVLEARRDSLLPQFILEKDKKYQDVGNYMIPSQTTKNNVGNSYLRAQVSENGAATISSIYRGKAISHTGVKLSVGDNYVECSSPLNSYKSRHMGVTTERLDYSYGNDGGLMDFIAIAQSPVTVELLGDKPLEYTLRSSDAEAIGKVLELTKVLQSLENAKEMRAEAERHIEFILRSREKSQAAADSIE